MSNKKPFKKKNKPFQNHEIRDQLERAASQSLYVRGPKGEKKLFRSADSWKGDGVDHINIDFFSETELGQMLDFGYKLNFRHKIFQNFATISGFWAYIRSNERPDQLRYLFGRQLQELSHELTNRKVKHLRAMIMDAAYQRIKSNNTLSTLVYNNELPFDMYKTADTGVRIRPAHHLWVVDGYTEIAKAIQEGRDPNFDFLTDGPTEDIYESVRPAIPESLLKRKQAAKEQNKVEHKPVQKPQSAEAPKEQRPQKKKDEYTFKPENQYSLLVPNFIPSTDGTEDNRFLPHFKKTIKINDVAIETAPVVTAKRIDLLTISDNASLLNQGLQSDEDVIRAYPIHERTFASDFISNNVIKLDSFIVKDEDDYISIPLYLKLINRSFERDNDQQQIEHLNDTLDLSRRVFLYKQIDDVVTEGGKKAKFLQRLDDLLVNVPKPETFKYAVFDIRFAFKFSSDVNPFITLDANIRLSGVSDGSFDDRQKTTIFFEDEIKPLDANGLRDTRFFPVHGFTFTLYRGKIRQVTDNKVNEEPVTLQVPELTDAEVNARLRELYREQDNIEGNQESEFVETTETVEEPVVVEESEEQQVETESNGTNELVD